MHHLIHKIPNNRPMVAEPTIRIYAEITAYQTSVLFLLRIVYAKSRQELGKSNTTNSRINDLERLKKHFEKVMSFIIIQLGTDAFAKYKVENEKLKLQSHFNAAVYDAISIAISDKIMEDETFTITTQMKQRLKQLFFNDDFIDSINGSTNDKSKILKRIKIVKGVLK